jgi:IrrE N-terminal-like domain
MAIEEALFPESIAGAIHAQLPNDGRSVRVDLIAAALDFVEIRREPLQSFEGALITTPDRDIGSILVNSASHLTRQRFTIAHELGHFLIPSHVPTDGGFHCSRSDLLATWRMSTPEASRQESEANIFAIELLAPMERLAPYLLGAPDLAEVIKIADNLVLSRQASARRYLELHDYDMALLFSKKGILRYIQTTSHFPPVKIRPGDSLPPPAKADFETGVTVRSESDQKIWMSRPNGRTLLTQTLPQSKGFAITLLTFEGAEPTAVQARIADPQFDSAPFDRLDPVP